MVKINKRTVNLSFYEKESRIMKSLGIVRHLDDLGRIVIPKELCKSFDLHSKDPLEIFTEDDKIILKKYQPSCIFCKEASDVIEYDGKTICRSCAEKIAQTANIPYTQSVL